MDFFPSSFCQDTTTPGRWLTGRRRAGLRHLALVVNAGPNVKPFHHPSTPTSMGSFLHLFKSPSSILHPALHLFISPPFHCPAKDNQVDVTHTHVGTNQCLRASTALNEPPRLVGHHGVTSTLCHLESSAIKKKCQQVSSGVFRPNLLVPITLEPDSGGSEVDDNTWLGAMMSS